MSRDGKIMEKKNEIIFCKVVAYFASGKVIKRNNFQTNSCRATAVPHFSSFALHSLIMETENDTKFL